MKTHRGGPFSGFLLARVSLVLRWLGGVGVMVGWESWDLPIRGVFLEAMVTALFVRSNERERKFRGRPSGNQHYIEMN